MESIAGLRGTALDERQRALIVRRRKEKELTQKDLAEATGLKPITIHSIETGKCKPSPSALAQICRALNMECRIVLKVELVVAGENVRSSTTMSLGKVGRSKRSGSTIKKRSGR